MRSQTNVADLLPNIDHAQVLLAAGVEAEKERVRAILQIGEVLEAIGFAGGHHREGDERRRLIARQAAILLEPLFFIEALGLRACNELPG
jgi:hypothetical protein